MQLTKHISIKGRVAEYMQRDGFIICHNSDYKVSFTFDAEWDNVAEKYARFVWGGKHKDVKFTGTTCSVPAIRGASFVQVGVYTGDPEHLTEDDFFTTLDATIPCQLSILDLADIEHTSGGGGGEQPTLYAPDISLNLRAKVLTIVDSKNGLFPAGYNVFKNGVLLGLVQKGTVALTDYTDYDGDATIGVSATADRFNDSPAATLVWTRPKLYTPTIEVNSVTSVLTITDTNGTAAGAFEVYAGDILLVTTSEKNVILSDYMTITETQNVRVKSVSADANYLDSDLSEPVKWYEYIAGTEGLAYIKSVADEFYTCAGIGSATDTDIIIATIHEGLPVTAIKSMAFSNCRSLTSITIPESVTTIGSSAFSGCDSLTSITIPDSVTSMGNSVFHYCDSLTSVTIGNSVTIIGTEAFAACPKLTSVTIPDSVTRIGDNAFYWCTSLTSVTIPDSVTSIGEGAFNGCTSLTSVTIGNSVTSIGGYAFHNCTSLTSVTIPDSVTSIGGYAFYKCSSLTSVVMGDGLTNIGSSVFSECNSALYTEYEFYQYVGDASNPYKMLVRWGSKSSTYTIHENTRYIGGNALGNNNYITSVSIPNSVTSIGAGAFRNCVNLKDVYYSGTKAEWESITISSENDYLLNATIHYNSEV